ncbi:AAA family ATPase [Pyxidicoccus trucidator]|uniref:nSTAND1 domain-containing NTPase n=1 Tax=Pyxidicoccus trucidator TaxID=2709662 RepID=UPI0013DD347C|nr:AAA family ATPase [Pyxidicoccus trucidator]
MNGDAVLNPFPGPQPFRAADQDRFFGREDTARKLMNRILAHPCVMLFGPSGSGKSSLMQASVIPLLKARHGFRTVRVDGWLAGEAPLERLARDMFVDLELGKTPEELGPHELLGEAIRLAERRSERPILIYLDQLEQLLLSNRSPEQLRELFDGLETLARAPVRGLQMVLALREDYLGRFQDRARGHRALHDPGFRLGPLTVKEMAPVACRLAATGVPHQQWSSEELRELMLQMRTAGQSATDEAEVQAAFAQIVCRALWEERRTSAGMVGLVEAEPILHRYLDATLDSLGPLKPAALMLLEEHLVARDGSRTLLTQQQADAALPQGAAAPVLNSLERSAVLHAEQHEGGRYFELGHDWLAKKVLELKLERQKQEKAARDRQTEARRRRQERVARRKLVIITTAAAGVALMMVGLFLYGLWARREAEANQALAQASEEQAINQSLMAGAREQMQRGQPAMAAKLLAEVKHPETLEDWPALAQEALDSNFLEMTLQGLSGESFNAAAFSPNGQRIVTASDDGTVMVWWTDGREEAQLVGRHNGPVTSAQFSQDEEGRFIVTASRDETARVWEQRSSGEWEARDFPHKGSVRSASLSRDGKRLLTASRDGSARVWRIEDTKTPLQVLRHGRINFAAFSPGGQRIVTTSWDQTAQVWRADGSGRFSVRQTLAGHAGPVQSAAFSPDGKRIVTASQDGTAQVWRADGSGRFSARQTLSGHAGPVQSAAFSLDGQRIVTASQDGTARVWQVRDSDTAVMLMALEGHMGPVTSAAFSPGGQRIVTASQDGSARVWHTDRMKQPLVTMGMEHEQSVVATAFTQNGKLVTASRDGVVRIWQTEPSPRMLEELPRSASALTSVAISQDGQRIVTTSRDRSAPVRVWQADGSGHFSVGQPLPEQAGPVHSAAISPDGKRIVTASQDGAQMWWAEGRGPSYVLDKVNTGPVTSVAFSPDGQRIVTASRDKTARVWEQRSGEWKERSVFLHKGPVASAKFSQHENGRFIVTASQDGKARVWEEGRSEPLHEFPHEGPVLSAAFSPKGQLIVTTSWDKTARVWRTDEQGQPHVLKGHEGPVRSAAFSPDGRFIVTASWDKTARLWTLPEETPTSQMLPRELAERNTHCLSPAMRQTYLKEGPAKAWQGYEQCERDHLRVPSQAVALRSDSRAAGSPSRM